MRLPFGYQVTKQERIGNEIRVQISVDPRVVTEVQKALRRGPNAGGSR